MQRISSDLQLYSHQHAILFNNAKTTVRLGLYDSDTVVAVKRTNKPADERSLIKALREKDTLKALDHPHIVRYFGHTVDNSFIYVALEPFVRPLVRGQKAQSMTLRDLVKAQRPSASRGARYAYNSSSSVAPLGRAAKIAILRQITEAVAYLHGLRSACVHAS